MDLYDITEEGIYKLRRRIVTLEHRRANHVKLGYAKSKFYYLRKTAIDKLTRKIERAKTILCYALCQYYGLTPGDTLIKYWRHYHDPQNRELRLALFVNFTIRDDAKPLIAGRVFRGRGTKPAGKKDISAIPDWSGVVGSYGELKGDQEKLQMLVERTRIEGLLTHKAPAIVAPRRATQVTTSKSKLSQKIAARRRAAASLSAIRAARRS